MNEDKLAVVDENGPDVNGLLEEYERAWSQDPDASGRIAAAEDIRYTRWAGQSADGLKHQERMPEGTRALPYDRAPDCRVMLADATILSLVDTEYAAFWNARVKTAPAAASRMSVAQAAEWRQVVSWMIHGPLRSKLIDGVEFASQVANTIGWCVLHPVWRRKTQLRLTKLTLDAILQIAAKAPPESVMAQLPELIANPELEGAAAELLRSFFPNLSAGRGGRVVRELRSGGEAEFPTPEVESNVPELAVLVPWQDFILPAEATANPDEARVMFRRIFFNAPECRSRAREEEWNEEFLAEVLKTAGAAMEQGTSAEHSADANNRLIEIVYAYNRGVDEDGVPGIYCTVISPHIKADGGGGERGGKGNYGAHWLVDCAHGQHQFIFITTEVTGRRPGDARGVPDVVATGQQEMKMQRDATYVFSQLSVTPPLQKKGAQASKLPPELGPLGIINNVSGGEWSWFPPPPGKPEIAFKLTEDVRKEAQDYYGVPRMDTPPMIWQSRQQRKVMRWLAKWGEALWQLSVLAYQHLTPEELFAVLGRQPLLSADLVAKHRLLLWFDVRSQDPAWVESTLKAMTEVLAGDVAGVTDRSKATQFMMAYLDPTLAEELTTDQQGAKQAVFKGVREEISSIMQGNEGLYVENDPTAKTKLLFARQIIQANPEYQGELHPHSAKFNGRKRELMEKWFKNLQQSAVQMVDNKMVGRLGVKPGPGQ